ncbi:MAG: phosphoribosylformylglycinamidine cyclo-ligase [Chloroflexota bacterium]|nr:phosphoribosylformylglycinamidine cyclo-ligase [Chloroflexota bacterium]
MAAAKGEVYRQAGVDIDAGNRAVALMRSAVLSTHGPQVRSGTGLFGGVYALDGATVLVASTDSVGTKLRLGARLGRHEGIGMDLVNHCVNDILTLGARPLFFLDYFASSKLEPEVVAHVVGGLASACRDAGCALLGGETAELPGIYLPGEYDVAGFIVGSVRPDKMLDGSRVESGDVLLGLPSSGLHTNGFSLVNHILDGRSGGEPVTDAQLLAHDHELGGALADVLLEPHRSYLPLVAPLLKTDTVKAMAHITGGGLIENLPRCLPEGLSARVDTSTWTPPPIFSWLQERGRVSAREMYRVFNMGVGIVLVVGRDDAEQVSARLPGSWVLGDVVRDDQTPDLLGLDGA